MASVGTRILLFLLIERTAQSSTPSPEETGQLGPRALSGAQAEPTNCTDEQHTGPRYVSPTHGYVAIRATQSAERGFLDSARL